MSPRDRSLRPMELLPPTLLPNPVLMAAPRPDRGTSLVLACTVYCALGAAVLGGTRHLAAVAAVGGTHEELWTLAPDKPAEPVLRPPQPAGGGVRPPGFRAAPVVTNPNVMPVVVPPTTQREDQSLLLPPGSDKPAGPGVEGLPPGPGPAVEGVPAHAAAPPLELDFRQLRILKQVAPVYPALAKLVRAQGTVELRMTIDAAGVPTEVEVVSGPHPLLIAEAVRTARLWRFQPATVDGAAVAASFRLMVAFRLSS